MDSRCHAWAHLLIAALKDATPGDAVQLVVGALERAVSTGAREEREAAIKECERVGRLSEMVIDLAMNHLAVTFRRGEHVRKVGG
jgi:hypothetical protein